MLAGARVGKTLLPEVEINAVTGALKLYFRELPEAVITDALYPELIETYSKSSCLHRIAGITPRGTDMISVYM